ncbi:MAG TPA: BatA domain-containing protein [Candidatus Cloacimonadota bacterium]|nr:BatA domain-containing protein [Candidatus Cloacimonadota bacterium]HPM00940.1 BatA domain-containing protein [Candidatus Cloacimonadota bacterium]
MFNLSFLNAGILIAGLAAIIPLLIHLFAKQKPKKIYFSSLLFIKKSLKERNKSIKIKNILLIIIRTLIILLSILAIARPALKIPILKNKQAHHDTAVAIILDNSLSMDYLTDTETEFQKAKSTIQKINNMLMDKDISILLTRDKSWNQLNSQITYGKISEEILPSIDLSWNCEKMSDVIEIAKQKLQETHYLNKEIYIVSDYQNENDLPLESDIPIFYIPVSEIESRHNIACIRSEVQSVLTGHNQKKTILFDIQNFSDQPYNDVIIKMTLNSAVVAEKMLSLQAGQIKSESFIVPAPQPGWNHGWIEVKNERFTPDNRHFFSFFTDTKIHVGILADSPIPKSFLSMLKLYGATYEIIDSQNFSNSSISQYSFFIVYYNQFPARLHLMLNSIKNQNKNALILLKNGMNSEDINWLENLSGTKISKHDSKEHRLSYINVHHPLTNLFTAQHIRNQEVLPVYHLQVNSGINPLIQASDNLIAHENYFVFWNIDVSNEKQDFLYESFFPVFAYRSFQYVNMSHQSKNDYYCGDPIELFDAQIKENFNPPLSVKNSNYTFTKTGIYEITEKENEPVLIPVNIKSFQESGYQRIKQKSKDNIYFLDSQWENHILQSRLGYEIWKYLFVLVLFLILAEMILIKKHENRIS